MDKTKNRGENDLICFFFVVVVRNSTFSTVTVWSFVEQLLFQLNYWETKINNTNNNSMVITSANNIIIIITIITIWLRAQRVSIIEIDRDSLYSLSVLICFFFVSVFRNIQSYWKFERKKILNLFFSLFFLIFSKKTKQKNINPEVVAQQNFIPILNGRYLHLECSNGLLRKDY